MSVKASISITDQQDAFARKLVEDGHYDSLSDVVQHGLDLVRQETQWSEGDREALVALLNERMDGEFVTMEESRRRVQSMIEANRKIYGL
ncbi:antitoxin ParD1/3/4 [Rhizobium sp. NFR07]|uniref:ribbon-helix-helix domain-containing protein n=1 Tax=Rhizobium sp. NFR07 TaxID=1566262 RepID=UPI0008EEFE69|nr:type II toxin-antitoxin system ParD family antitoxin [Rhizobium sp. NFR07]SFA89061.1 antitoxin ParD1/3/4 [Rhizobium sp. NFR07]